MEIKQKYENALKSVTQFAKIQKRIFFENSVCIQKATVNTTALSKIKQETESQLQELPSTEPNKIIRQLNKLYFLTDLNSQKNYYLKELLPQKDQSDPILSKEFERARVFVLANCVEFYLERLDTHYSKIRNDPSFLNLDKFLKSQDTADHVKGCLAKVFEKFLINLTDKLSAPGFSIRSLLESYAQDLEYLLVSPLPLKIDLYSYFLNYIRGTLLESLAFKYNNDAQVYLQQMESLYHFFAEGRSEYPTLAKQFEKTEKTAFGRIRDFLADYFDKFEVVRSIDSHFDFLDGAFKAYESKALKIWLVDLIDSYVDSSHNKETDVFNKYSLVFKLEKVKFGKLEKFLKTYLRKKNEGFLKNELDKIIRFDLFGLLEKPDSISRDPAKLAVYFKDFFRRFLDHVTRIVIPNVKACYIKELDFHNHIYNAVIKSVVAPYHKQLGIFLALDLTGIDKKQCVELYANDLEEQMKEDLFGF